MTIEEVLWNDCDFEYFRRRPLDTVSGPGFLVAIWRSTHRRSVTTESVDGSRLSAIVFVIWKSTTDQELKL